MLTKEELPLCPVATTLWLIGNKWKILTSLGQEVAHFYKWCDELPIVFLDDKWYHIL